MKSYEKEQQRVQSTFFKKRGLNLSGDNLYPYILSNSDVKWNFFNESLYRRAVAYFRENQITWWKGKRPTTNTLSSQVSCINHLMPLMDNKGAVLNLLKSIDSSFDDVLPLYENKPKEFIGFEVVSDIDHLGEIKSSKPHRGSVCTSIDAVILGSKNEKKVLVTIEWKYTEKYYNKDLSVSESGTDRTKIYGPLIERSLSLVHLPNGGVYYHDPFYQIMRQTLWAEQMILPQNMEIESIKADDYIHVHIVPSNNRQFLKKTTYSVMPGKKMEDIWRSMLSEYGNKRFAIIDPSTLYSLMDKSDSSINGLVRYLSERYWQ